MSHEPAQCSGRIAWRGRRGRCGGRRRWWPLPPKALAVLWTLVSQAGQVVIQRGAARRRCGPRPW